MSEHTPPERIYLIDYDSPNPDDRVWCPDPDPSGQGHTSVEYVRTHLAYPAAVQGLIEAAKDADAHFGPFAEIVVNGKHDSDDVRVITNLRTALARMGVKGGV